MPILGYCHEPPRSTIVVGHRGRPVRSTVVVPQFTKMHADQENTAASLAVSLMRGLQQVVVCQLSKWVWEKNAGADTALEYVNTGVRYREV